MKNKAALIAVFWLALPAPSRAEDQASPFRLSGRAFEDLYYPTKDHDSETFLQENTSLWLQGDARVAPELSARATYQGDLFGRARLTGDRPGPHLRNRLRDGYAEYFANGLDLRMGKQIIPWGKSDGVNPTDFLSARESNFLNHDGEVERVGGVSLLASLTPAAGASPWNVTAVVQPWFPKSDYLVPPAALPAGVTLYDAQDPERNLKNTELAGKISYTGSGWDASMSYFHGFDHRPVFAEISHQAVSPSFALVRANRIFQRLNAAGADASYSAGAMVYRLETAYSWTENNDGRNPLLTPSHFDTVVGAERPFFDNFRAQAQFISRYFPHYTDPNSMIGPDAISTAIDREISVANALLQQYQHAWNTASTLRVSYTLESPSLSAELLWYKGLNDGDYYLRPLLGYGWNDFLHLSLGYDHYGGPADKSIGALQSYNALFTELKIIF